MGTIQDFYNNNAHIEISRLDEPFRQLEYRSTLYLIDKYFPKCGKICDIGAGSGKYSLELLKKGYNVTLLDISQTLLEHARKYIESNGHKAEDYLCKDSRQLHIFENNSFDACLLMGPMYHILEKEERLKVLQHLYRVLKPNGVAIIAYLNSWGVIKAGIDEFPESFGDINNLRKYLGECFQRQVDITDFTDAYFSTPPVALSEVKQAGFELISYAGVEGFAAGMIALIENHSKTLPQTYQNIIQVVSETCELEQYRDTTEHLHIVVKKFA